MLRHLIALSLLTFGLMAQSQAQQRVVVDPRLEAIRSLVESSVPVRVDAIDGDTIVRNNFRIRISGMDTPELHSRCPQERVGALHAKARMQELGQAGVTIEVQPRLDKYGRVLAMVRTPEGRNVAEIMISENLARSYDGHTRGSWC